MLVNAFYFDGKTSRRHAVTLQVQDEVAHVQDEQGSSLRRCPLHQLKVSERFSQASRKVTFPDGAYLEIQDEHAFVALLNRTHHRDSLVVRMQQNVRASIAAMLALIALLVLSYFYVLPAAAQLIADTLPASVGQSIGKNTLEFLDRKVLAPTQLPPARQEAIQTRFHMLTSVLPDAPPYQIVFRQSRIGANALALPSGQIILTDQIINLLNDDDAVMGVLALELGHVQHRDLMRQLLQGSMIAAATTLLWGDFSAVLANIPTVILNLKYSRDIERDADDYALALFKLNGMDRQKLADVFIKLERQEHGSGNVPPYLSTHPGNAERIQRILQAH